MATAVLMWSAGSTRRGMGTMSQPRVMVVVVLLRLFLSLLEVRYFPLRLVPLLCAVVLEACHWIETA
jgi:hypothetical protein